ncbi:MAG: hypothetical protein AAFQ04_06335 [Pseudomonadota bacterium]
MQSLRSICLKTVAIAGPVDRFEFHLPESSAAKAFGSVILAIKRKQQRKVFDDATKLPLLSFPFLTLINDLRSISDHLTPK